MTKRNLVGVGLPALALSVALLTFCCGSEALQEIEEPPPGVTGGPAVTEDAAPACEAINMRTTVGSSLPAIGLRDCSGNPYRLDELADRQATWLYIYGNT